MDNEHLLKQRGVGVVSHSPPTVQTGRGLLLENARMIDCTGAPPCAPTAILMHDGKIEKIGSELQANDVPILDVAWATVMPGLIDAHVHLQCVPASAYREDREEELRKARFHHLGAYLACEVTTVPDAAISAPALRDIHADLSLRGVGPKWTIEYEK